MNIVNKLIRFKRSQEAGSQNDPVSGDGAFRQGAATEKLKATRLQARRTAPVADAGGTDASAIAVTAEGTGLGAITGCDLRELSSLTRPFARDPFYRLRPPFSAEAARLSVELANMTYNLELEPWMAAGWNDFSIQIDNTLQSGLTHGQSANGERMQGAINAWKMMRAKSALRELNPVSQVMGALRQRKSSDTIKAVCMIHKREDGGYVVAIGFMGTGKRFYDWFSNFRFSTEEGFHKGFHQLCEYFEQGAESIVFPQTAAELGLEKLTLGEILHEMSSAQSRFRVWMTGHSQGAAVMQVFAHRLIRDWGVLPQNMVGYGFAAPTVATGALVYDPASYPLYHILNSDDIVAEMGALIHLGLCLSYPATDEFRSAAYALSMAPEDVEVREAFAPMRKQMVDTPSILLYSSALLQCLAEEKGEETMTSIMNKKWSVAPIDWVLNYAGDLAQGWMNKLIEGAQNGHLALTGKPMDQAALVLLCESMRPIVKKYPFSRLMGALLSYCLPPHHILRNQHGDLGAYAYIVLNGISDLRPFIWVKQEDAMPVKRFGDWADSGVMPGGVEIARRLPAKRKKRAAIGSRTALLGKRELGISALRRKKSGIIATHKSVASFVDTVAQAAAAAPRQGVRQQKEKRTRSHGR